MKKLGNLAVLLLLFLIELSIGSHEARRFSQDHTKQLAYIRPKLQAEVFASSDRLRFSPLMNHVEDFEFSQPEEQHLARANDQASASNSYDIDYNYSEQHSPGGQRESQPSMSDPLRTLTLAEQLREMQIKLNTIQSYAEFSNRINSDKLEKNEAMFHNFYGKMENSLEDINKKIENLKSALDEPSPKLVLTTSKILNLNMETYRICKEAVRTPDTPMLFQRQSGRKTNAKVPYESLNGDDEIKIHHRLDPNETYANYLKSGQFELDTVMSALEKSINKSLARYLDQVEKKVSEVLQVFKYEIMLQVEESGKVIETIQSRVAPMTSEMEQLTTAVLVVKEFIGNEATRYNSRIESVTKSVLDAVKSLLTSQPSPENANSPVPETATAKVTVPLFHMKTLDHQHINHSFTEIFDRYWNQVKSLVVNQTSKLENRLAGLAPGCSTSHIPDKSIGARSFSARSSNPSSQFIASNKPNLTQHSPSNLNNFVIYDSSTASDDNKTTPGIVVNKISARNKLAAKCIRSLSSSSFPGSCFELHSKGVTCDGVYQILTPAFRKQKIYCDMSDGGWGVVLRRGPRFVPAHGKRVSFEQKFSEYRTGFGNRDAGEHFLGLDAIQILTLTQHHQLKVDIGDRAGNKRSYVYDNFHIGPLADSFRFHIGAPVAIVDNSTTIHRPEELSSFEQDLAAQLTKLNRTRFYSQTLSLVPIVFRNPIRLAERHFLAACQRKYLSDWWYLMPELPKLEPFLNLQEELAKYKLDDVCHSIAPVQLMAPLESTGLSNAAEVPYYPMRWHGWFGRPTPNASDLASEEANRAAQIHADIDYVIWKIRPKLH